MLCVNVIAMGQFLEGFAVVFVACGWCAALVFGSTLSPTPFPTTVRDPDHEFDFRGCEEATVTARYIYIEQTEDNPINLREVTAYDAGVAEINKAAATATSPPVAKAAFKASSATAAWA